MQIVLSDYNCIGQAQAIFQAFAPQGFIGLAPAELRLFADVGLADDTDDETVWRFCQDNSYLLLTGNRRTTDGERSLEMILRRLVAVESLPVLTIGNLPRVLVDSEYRDGCAQRLAEIVLDLEDYRGLYRVYLPGVGYGSRGGVSRR